MKSSAQISTTQAARIAKRLANHWKHKFEVSEQENEKGSQFQIHLNAAQVILSPQPDFLEVAIQTQDTHADLDKLEHVVLDHLIRMGQEELSAEWQRDSL
ncbi:hypothetical protein B9T33_09145 [Acinetobacter sp. ANC 5054]|uniref:DUF2218 domain-containing protein n=1 Tax=Acinetobacter sp. ANC 5054 TaxID=1977877 RepID=UPI000A34E4A4|nr:DUF2218 domain-containing protein [Acinetobacter sp. ANC 5054]OTG80580.1 hypothetical protein B9T33_09145 [Acinetobacter sp. ANC 5054]